MLMVKLWWCQTLTKLLPMNPTMRTMSSHKSARVVAVGRSTRNVKPEIVNGLANRELKISSGLIIVCAVLGVFMQTSTKSNILFFHVAPDTVKISLTSLNIKAFVKGEESKYS